MSKVHDHDHDPEHGHVEPGTGAVSRRKFIKTGAVVAGATAVAAKTAGFPFGKVQAAGHADKNMKARFTYLVAATYLIEIGSFRFLDLSPGRGRIYQRACPDDYRAFPSTAGLPNHAGLLSGFCSSAPGFA